MWYGLDIAYVLDTLYPSLHRENDQNKKAACFGCCKCDFVTNSKKPWLSHESRLKHETYHSLMRVLQDEDPSSLKNLLQMVRETFQELLQIIFARFQELFICSSLE